MLYKIDLGRYDILGLPRTVITERIPGYFFDLLYSLIWTTKYEIIGRPITVLILMVIIATAAMIIKHARSYQNQSLTTKRALGFCLTLLVVPLVLFFFSPQSVNYTTIVQRHVLFVTIPIALVLGWLLVQLPTKVFGALLLSF